MRLFRIVLVLALAVAVAFVALRPFRIAVLAAAVTPELLDVGPKPLSAMVPAPRRQTVAYGADDDLMDVYHPGGDGRRPAVVLVLGVHPVPRDHPAVVRTAEALGRLGLVVAVPESAATKAGEIRPAEPGRLVDAILALMARTEVDPDRIGLAGFSVGGSVALVAASDPRIADRIAYVNAFGAYADPSVFLVDIATRTMVVGAERLPWQPGDSTRSTYLQLVLGFLGDEVTKEEIRSAIEAGFLGEGAPPRPTFDRAVAARLEGDALALYELSTAAERASAEAAVARLSPLARGALAALSPVDHAAGLRAPVYLMHDRADDAIPYSHLGLLEAAMPSGTLQQSTLLDLFDHVQPRQGIDAAALPELGRLGAHLMAVLDRALPE